MVNAVTHSQNQCVLLLKLNPNCRRSKSSCSVFPKPYATFPSLTTQICHASFHRLPFADTVSDTKHRTLLVETYHHHGSLRALLVKLEREDSNPVNILAQDGDWSKDHFWAAVRFLKHATRFAEILQVFDMWKNIEKSRISEFNYNKIIGLLCEDETMEEALAALQEMKAQGMKPSLDTYNTIIHGLSRAGKFSDALRFFDEMKESGLEPDSETYDGLIGAYGKFQMYDEMGECLKKMELDGCPPDHITYNILIREYARGGLLQRMEKLYQRMLSKRMKLQSYTFVTMLKAYTTFGIVEKMEKFYRKVLNSKTCVEDDVIRKMAEVYIKNYMFSRLEDLALDLCSAFGESDLVWCLRLLSYACLLSKKGMDIVVKEMLDSKINWSVAVANIIMLAYVKMKDFRHLRILLSQLPIYRVRPDIVTVGIVMDASRIGFDGRGALESWRRMGYLDRVVELNTDSLVITAFGKGHFLKSCEEVYSSLHPEDRERKKWTYNDLIALLS
ncbi:pentatricopeptide repeat-containing protein At4g14190, chloroplastic [Vigna radiata var. radiata]|uniref:Pentatricopeptide repeat-containing protein At4g14190, chloroplastic n=1 Tax=Vigna radiata var. radiata TaxID=3916 RepID=A0A1S3VTN0_VIGRR|nr:pentatricopeptide repeat-containing protein At4g14190, chloroplastic [Vigna radiata var. radiata]